MQSYCTDIALSLRNKIPRTGEGRKLVLVIPGVPHPSEGASVVLYFWYAYALRQAGYKILNILLLSNDDDLEKLVEFRALLDEGDDYRIEAITCTHPIVYGKLSGPQSVDERLARQVAGKVNEFQPEILVCFDFLSAWAASLCAANARVAWLGDLNFQTSWHHGIYAFERGNYRSAVLGFLYSRPWKKCYIKALKNFTKIVVSSASSEGQLAKLGLDAEYLPYPWPSEEEVKRMQPAIPTLAFFGTLGALGSLSSFQILLNDIHPKLRQKYGKSNFKIKIFGRGELPPFAKRIVQENPEIEVLGFVPDLRPVLAGCHALIAPIEAPVGNRSRILTALALRLPVIAHTNTALGNPDLRSGINCCLGINANQMLEHFYCLLDNPDHANSLAEQGRQLYLNKFHPLSASMALLERIHDLALPLSNTYSETLKKPQRG